MKKRLIIILSGILALLALQAALVAYPFAAKADDPVAAAIRNGDKFMSFGSYKEAIKEYDKALRLDPDNSYARQQKTQCQDRMKLQSRELDQLDKSYQKSSNSSSNSSRYLPPRNYKSISHALDTPVVDYESGFSIRPPADWVIDKDDSDFTMKISDPGQEAFIFIDVIYFETDVIIDKDFRKFLEQKNRSVKGSVNSYFIEQYRSTNFKGKDAIESKVKFMAGNNVINMNIIYFVSGRKLFMITTICQRRLDKFWDPLFKKSLLTFSIIED